MGDYLCLWIIYMSIHKISKEPTVLESRRTVIVTQDLSSIGSQPFQVNLQQYQIDFIPTRMVLRQIAYVNMIPGGAALGNLGTDEGIFTVWSSVSRQAMAFINVGPLGITATTEQVINLPAFSQSVEFTVNTTPSSVAASGIALTPFATLTQPTGFVAMALEFF